MGGEHRTLGILPHSSGFPKGLETPDYPTWWEFFLFYSFGDDSVIYQLPREKSENPPGSSLWCPGFPTVTGLHTAFLSWKRLLFHFCLRSSHPRPYRPDSHLLGSEPHPIRDPWPTSLHLHQPMKKEAVCIFPTATPLSFPILCLWHFPSGWHPWIDSCRTRNGGHKRHPGVVRREQRMGGGGWEEIFSFYALVRF